MGSETGAKWLIMLLLYFTVMTVIVTLVSDITPTPISTTGGYDLGSNTSAVGCSLPRTYYQLDIPDGGSDWYVAQSYANTPDETGHIQCENSKGQLSNTTCLAISGCDWEEEKVFWFFGTGDYSCVGVINETWINTSDIETFHYIGYDLNYIVYDDGLNSTGLWEDRPVQGICGYDAVVDNQTRCEEMSCTWGITSHQIDYFTAQDIEVELGMGKKIWTVVKEMVTFKFDFGFENGTANFILNFLIFWLPLIGLGLAIYVMVRS